MQEIKNWNWNRPKLQTFFQLFESDDSKKAIGRKTVRETVKKKFLPLIYTKKSRCQQIISNLLKIDTAVHFQWRTFPTGSLNKAHGNVKAVFWLRMSEVSASAAKWSVGVVNVSVTSAMQSNMAHGRVGISKLLIIWAVSQAKLSEHHAKCTWRKCFENPLLLYISKTPQSAFRWLSSTVVLRCLCPIKQV